MAIFISNSPGETLTIAVTLARHAQADDVIALRGELGAGKTQFVKGFAAGLNAEAPVTSPTFTLVHEYSGGRLPIFHFDFYRLENMAALEQIGFDDYLVRGGVCLVEWADKFPDALPARTTWVTLETTSEEQRTITVETPK